jgi:hypothetical protein
MIAGGQISKPGFLAGIAQVGAAAIAGIGAVPGLAYSAAR